MRIKGIYTAKPLSLIQRRAGITSLILFLVGLISLALTIPFIYETQSLWYKFGTDKLLLRGGKMVGLVAAILLCLQILMAARISLFDRLFGLDKLYRFHRFNGICILFLGIVHVSFVQIPEGLANLPIGKKYWPEMVGAFLLLMVAGLVSIALVQSRLRMKYSLWRLLHRLFGYLAFVLVCVHVLYVSESFTMKLPAYGLYGVAGTVVLLVAGQKLIAMWQNRTKAEVIKVQPLTGSVTAVSIVLPGKRSFGYSPGQFAYLAFELRNFREPHPFTISSAPTQAGGLEFMIKSSGDWTENVPYLKVGDKVTIRGPYGLFTHLAVDSERELIFIAGGIGITPILSMLRYMVCTGSEQLVTLIWCNSYPDDMFLATELDIIARNIKNLKIHLVYTRARHGSRRMDQDKIKGLTDTCRRDSLIYVCGPGPMIKRVIDDCQSLGFVRQNIYYEHFSL